MNMTSYYEAALETHPDLVLQHSDLYMSSLINTLSLQGKKNIFVLCGYGQSRTIPYHLYYNPLMFQNNSFNEVTKYNKPFKTLIREDTPEIMIDKLCIVD